MGLLSWLKGRRPAELDEEDFKEEIRAHLAIAAQEKIDDGANQRDAHYAALKEFGNVTRTTEAARSVWTPQWLEGLRDVTSDIRYAIRALAKKPAFTVTVVAVLTIGIGLNAAVFTMLKGFALTPIAGVADSARLGVIYTETGAGRDVQLSYPDYRYIRDHDRAFSGLVGSGLISVTLGKGRRARPVWGELVTGNYFQVLGVGAQLGRTILPSDEIAPGRHPVVVLSDVLWRHDFGADVDIIGKTVLINNYALTVVGVADPAFHGAVVTNDIEVFIPVMMTAQVGLQNTPISDIVSDRRTTILTVLGRLRPGTTLASAAAQIDALGAAMARDRPLTDATERLKVARLWNYPNGAPAVILPTLVVLSAMGLLVLTIACANIAGLVLVRGFSRRGEIAVRLALGATRARIIRLLIVENLVLAIPGAMLGVLLAADSLPILVGYAEQLVAPQRLFFNIEVNWLVIGFSVLVACGSALVFGFVPALRSSRVDLVSVINEDASPRGAARGRLRAGLVVGQVAVSLLLLVGAGLAGRSVAAARHTNPGFDASNVVSVSVNLRQNGYDEARGRVFYRKLLDRVRADAGVESATLAAYAPMGMIDTRPQPVAIEGYEPQRGEDLSFLFNIVASDYFRTLRINLVAGRAFEDRDDETAAPVAIVNETLAQRFWGGAANAVGKRIRVADGDWRSIIGVAADLKYARINEARRPYFYVPFSQAYRTSMVLHLRGASSPLEAPIASLAEHARALVAGLDPDLPIISARPLGDRIKGALVFYDLTATMLFVFGVAGMALAAMGTYGLVSYTVTQSTHEIGIRMALGATSISILRGYLTRGLRLGAVGATLGVGAALGATRLLSNVLFGVSATDPVSFAQALVLVLGIVIVATMVPAWRASRTNPLSALRHQ